MPRHGPHLAAALFCEKTLHERDGVLSLIRIIDRVTHTAQGPNPPEQMPAIKFQTSMVLILKSGEARGRHTLAIRPEAPSGQQLPEMTLDVHFEGGERAANVLAQMDLELDQEGVYWFDVILEPNQLLTRVPLQVMYQPQKTMSGAPPA